MALKSFHLNTPEREISLQNDETLFNLNAFYTEILKLLSNDLPIPTKTLLASKTCPKRHLAPSQV